MTASRSFSVSESAASGELDVKAVGKEQAMPNDNNNVVEKKKERFQVIESAFTTAVMDDVAVRGVYSIFVGIMSFNLVSMGFKYYYMEDLFHSDVSFLKRAFGQFHWVLVSEAAMLAIFFLMVLPAVRSRIENKINSFLFRCNIITAFLVLAIVPIYIRYAMDLNVVTAIAVIFEQIRYTMKFISFVVENERMDDSAELPTIKSSLYFLFAPTLVYQPSYPMKDTRDWKNIICWSIEILGLMWSTLTVLNHGFLDAFKDVGTRPLNAEDWFAIFNQSALLGPHVFIGIGYAFLHCWNNIWGELLFFGDRTFYKNFFAAGNMYSMFNKWNFLIHSWIVAYLYKPCIKYTKNRIMAAFYSFVVSFIVHDYVVAVPLKIWSFQFTANIVVVFLMLPMILALKDFLTKHPFPSTLNISLFFTAILGITGCTATAATKYFWQQNCPHAVISIASMLSGTPEAPVCL